MDNFRVDVTSEGASSLFHLVVIIANHRKKIVGWREDAEKGLVFYWTEAPGITKLLVPTDANRTADLILDWLSSVPYPLEPEHDGDNGKGWRLYNEEWGHVGGEWQAAFAVQPVWAMYGK